MVGLLFLLESDHFLPVPPLPPVFILFSSSYSRLQKTIVSMVSGMNEILSKDVYLVETIDKDHGGAANSALRTMKAVCLLRPTEENIRLLKQKLSLSPPEFAEYHLFFTNVVPGDALRRLADADKLGLVQQVQEFYADFYPFNSDCFSLSITGSTALSRPRSMYSPHEESALKRTHQGLLATLLALKTKPVIRYQASSEAAQKLALELTGTISGERELFTFNKTGSQTLLVSAVWLCVKRIATERSERA